MESKYLIAILIVAICACVIVGSVLGFFTNNVEYTTVNTVPNGTAIQLPADMTIKSNNSGIIVLSDEDTIVICYNSAGKDMASLMAFSNIKSPIFGNAFSGNTTITNPTVGGEHIDGDCYAWYNGNNETHDNILVISKNKNVFDYIISHINWISVNNDNTDTDADSSSSSDSTEQTVYAYKSDGTPMYSKAEADNYMLKKYGTDDYERQSNGYIDPNSVGGSENRR
ncbi:hypothetical protein [uncultured Methanobrevibacter sp.]|uniref:hypothetical protein n=1 Tax=uncultured Methanobrevibacter sp. TaxID=253161 RepID=UPI0025DA4A3B|nr:hypothetical protein [uncultured Methanobrevibacter sp.]